MNIITHTSRFILGASAVALLFMAACSDKNDWPDEPVINSLTFDEEAQMMFIDFTDGDGDFGITPGDPDFPEFLDPDSTMPNPYYHNLWVDYYELHDDEWELIELENTFNFIVPDLTPQGQTKQLEVTITYDMSFDLPYSADSDSVKFSVVLVDRAKHESLPVETGLLVITE